MGNLHQDFETYTELRYKLWDLCRTYVDSHKLAPGKNLYFNEFLASDPQTDEILLFFVDELSEPSAETISVNINDLEIFDKETELLNGVVTDLLTGRHLLNKRSEEQQSLHNEFQRAMIRLAMKKDLSEREKYLLRLAAMFFYEGARDMCEQLNIDYELLHKIL